MHLFIKHLRNYGTLNNEIEKKLEEKTCRVHKRRGDLILRQGQTNSCLFLIEKGSVRSYTFQEDREVTNWFGFEKRFLGSLLPSCFNLPSVENIEFLEDSTVHLISISDLNNLYIKYPEINAVIKKITAEYCQLLEENLRLMRHYSTKERYHNLLETYPEIPQRVSAKHLASFLGMTSETLSRIKK